MTTHADALLVVDVQHDFCPGGALGTERGNRVAEGIAGVIADYPAVVATLDWHIDPAGHFSDNPDFVDTWPVHCLADSEGARLHPALPQEDIDEFFYKGAYTAAYSGFEGASQAGTSLADYLRGRGIKRVDIVGIATDHCVRATTLDALREGFAVTVRRDLCSPVSEDAAQATFAELRAAGAELA
ncbi:nicotinamidase [Corynebacterium sp. HMSC04H06]|uniref:nicotinamidase n=1 Tax=Corynebacterium sp. HMSC04H06 TaxID=1581050 RepID=UPI0008A5105B|nr:nicotinamidase [Corynebacterium sp. HMSC04H06]OFS19189.1 nicotinamidase [Corynebacterium sp. HMSC04H06]